MSDTSNQLPVAVSRIKQGQKHSVFILNRYHFIQIHQLMNMAMSVVPHLSQESNSVKSIALGKSMLHCKIFRKSKVLQMVFLFYELLQ